ncbi:unnamed protein product [Meloidogyne enterolobii]|uniref:Uncharacterized protein n=1 Tax=Meloidogyne enterolobii TaxID=390850 RepID=A0ACB0YBE9_MELEN
MKFFSIIFIFVFAFFIGSEAIRMIRNYGQPSFSGGNMGGGGCCGGGSSMGMGSSGYGPTMGSSGGYGSNMGMSGMSGGYGKR